MLTLPASVRLFVATEAVDMRKGIDGLKLLASNVVREDPLSGHIFVFANRRGNVMKALWWDRTGFVVLMKRLERGTFRLPRVEPPERRAEIDGGELHLLLEGFDRARAKPGKRWYRSPHKSLAERNSS